MSDKKITAKQMYTRNALLGHEKLKENSHKPDLLSLELWNLRGELKIENAELDLALEAYIRNPSVENKNRLDREVGDCTNYLGAITAVTDGYKCLEREMG